MALLTVASYCLGSGVVGDLSVDFSWARLWGASQVAAANADEILRNWRRATEEIDMSEFQPKEGDDVRLRSCSSRARTGIVSAVLSQKPIEVR